VTTSIDVIDATYSGCFIGCTLVIKRSEAEENVQHSNALSCDPELKLSSIAVDLSLKGNCDSKHFKKPVLLEFYSKVSSDMYCI